MKRVKKILGVFVVIACALLLVPNNVNAADIDSKEALKEVFKGKKATIDGTTITLTGDVELKNEECDEDCSYDIVNLWGDDYVLNLNGHKLYAAEFYVIEGGSLEINDETGKGGLAAPYIMIEPGAKAVINNGTFIANSNGLIDNSGTLTINNGNFHSIWNFGTLTINDGKFANVSNDEGTLYINGGTFTAYKYTEELDGEISEFDYFTMLSLNAKTVITGGKFVTTGKMPALQIYGQEEREVNNDSINKLLGEGYIAKYDDSTCTEWEVSYNSVEIFKDESENIFNKIAPNGVWNITGSKPNDMHESDILLSAIARDIEIPKGYEVMAWAEPGEEFNPESVALNIYYNGRYLGEKIVKAVYNEPKKEIMNKVTPVLDKISEKINPEKLQETSFKLEDLYLINYLNVSKDVHNDSLALNFAKDLIKLTNGSNITYKFDYRCGDSGNDLYSSLGGRVIVYYDGVAVDTTDIALTWAHVLYVPSNTANTDEARIAAALKRIEEYLGKNHGITITAGKSLESLSVEDFDWNEYNLFDENAVGKNYYNVTIQGKTYKFVISTRNEKELEIPEFIASDVTSNITIKSNSNELPLDTAITVKEVTSEKIEKALGTSVYAAYDISLYSNAKQVNITKLETGKFVVNIPVPENLKDKDITVYYINSKGEKEEHKATVKDGIASFETNHFSTYVLTEKVEDIKNPNTYDGITTSIIMAIVSLIGITSVIICLKKKTRE